jgi:threonyl-tRNA synthetase
MEDNQKLASGDHRRLGQELDLYVFSNLVGPGLPLFTPRGTVLRSELDKYVQQMRDKAGFQGVNIPHITKKELYEKSGHWTKFKHDLFHIKSREGHEFAMKPMNCPHHTQIYAAKPRSYRELPIRYRETTTNYRDEQTGELNGLLRARSFTQDDAHVFCRESQVVEEFLKIWEIVEKFYKTFDFSLRLRLSSRDPNTPEAYAGKPEQWDKAEKELKEALQKHGAQNLEDGVGDAAFYGPKLDFVAVDSLGRDWQVATIQIDFAQPEGLELTYINEQGEAERPVMIHHAVMGSIERFLAVYIEHTGGKFPVWLAPEQVRVATLKDDPNILKMAKDVVEKAKGLGIRAELDDSNESVAKKVAEAEKMKVPYVIVVGEKEVQSGQIEPRVRADLPPAKAASIDEFLRQVADHAQARR